MLTDTSDVNTARTLPGKSALRIVLVCEHASHFIPPALDGLGLSAADRTSHAAWDPGALAVAERMAVYLQAPLVAADVSRLVYDCNRPPEAVDAMPARSEVIDVPGNRNLTPQQRAARVTAYYRPFEAKLRDVVKKAVNPVIVTIHSFTPIYHGKKRMVEIGVLHDSDARLADALLATADAHTKANVMRNAPYGPTDGVTHTLKQHALSAGHLNVMIEVRNDLIATPTQHNTMAQMLSAWLSDALTLCGTAKDAACQA